MNYNEVTQTTQRAIKKNTQRSIFANNWELSAKLIGGISIPVDVIKHLKGGPETFLEQSTLFPVIVDQLDIDELSLEDWMMVSHFANGIENANTQSASFVRDTGGGKPVDKKEIKNDNNIAQLTDEQLDYLLDNAEVLDEE